MERFQPYVRDSPRCKKLDTSLVDIIATNIHPMSVVEGIPGFVNALDPRYVLPSRRTITRSMLPTRYEHFWDELKVQMSCVQCTYL